MECENWLASVYPYPIPPYQEVTFRGHGLTFRGHGLAYASTARQLVAAPAAPCRGARGAAPRSSDIRGLTLLPLGSSRLGGEAPFKLQQYRVVQPALRPRATKVETRSCES